MYVVIQNQEDCRFLWVSQFKKNIQASHTKFLIGVSILWTFINCLSSPSLSIYLKEVSIFFSGWCVIPEAHIAQTAVIFPPPPFTCHYSLNMFLSLSYKVFLAAHKVFVKLTTMLVVHLLSCTDEIPKSSILNILVFIKCIHSHNNFVKVIVEKCYFVLIKSYYWDKASSLMLFKYNFMSS